MELLHPPKPLDVPAELTRPTRRFKTHAWLAVLALVLFIATYFALTYWFGWTAYRLARDGFAAGSPVWGIAKALPAAFVFAFLFRGLFSVKHAPNPLAVEILPGDEPNLFAFLHRIADEAGAPRPHRVFLSPDVNAGVFYDLSLLNLLFPSKKNLVVGLGLVNVLDLHEMRAVMAHEFGHFAQKSMAVGRWVYIAEQIAGSIVGARTGFDKVLDFIASIDLRVAWIGWIMKVFVWSIRAILDTVFLVVVLARQALSREMELQADLVAVSLTGSDALVHALHKLHAADEAYGNAAGLAQSQLARGKRIEDLYAAQTRMLETIRDITSDETYGVTPPLPERANDRAGHRVFPEGFAQPPKMWSTHPPSREREENAKRIYIPCKHDPRPAWVLFGSPEQRRREMTSHLLGLIAGPSPLPDQAPNQAPEETLSPAQVDDIIEENYGKTYLDRRYRGLYLGRGVTRNAEDVRQLYRDDVEHAQLSGPPSLDVLYPEDVAHELERWRSLEEEHAMLNALHDGFLEAPGGVVRYRGEEVRRRDLKKVIDRVDAERKAALALVVARDREVRTAHRLAARAIGGGWEEYLTSLVALVHYAEHTEGDIRDADGHFQNVFQIVIADGRVSNAERKRLVAAAHEAFDAVSRPFWQKDEVHLPEPILKRLGIESWSARLGDFGLGTPTEENIPDWLRAADSWLLSVPNDFADLRAVALEVLVDTEEHVARCARGECEAGDAPAPAWLPQPYRTLVPGNERERQKKLDLWDRFQLADGFFPAVARLGVALAVLGVGFFLGGAAMERSVIVYNGLGVYVDVDIDGETASLRPGGSVELPLASDEVRVVASAGAGELIEDFVADTSNSQAHYVYNVASAAPLYEWRAIYARYGGGGAEPPRFLGAPRWTATEATVHFREPPRSVSSRSGSSSILVLHGAADQPAERQLSVFQRPEEVRAAALAHARFDDPASADFATWVYAAREAPELPGILATRLGTRSDVELLRLEQDLAGDAHEQVCARHQALAAESQAPDHLYLAARCITDPRTRAEATLDAYARHPDHPFLAFAGGMALASRGHWDEAITALERARTRPSVEAPSALALTRLQRLKAPRFAELRFEALARVSPEVEYRLALERGEDWVMQGDARAYALLARGELEPALAAARSNPDVHDDIVRLAAASDGAPESARTLALALAPDRGVDPLTVWSAIAHAMRHGADVAPLVATAREHFDDAIVDAMLPWADPNRLREDPQQLAAGVEDLVFPLRSHARVMALIVLDGDVPDEWRHEARAALFASERPYFRP